VTGIPRPPAGIQPAPQHGGPPPAGSLSQALPPDGEIAHPARVRAYDRWAASYDSSQLQAVLYGPIHDAVLRYARQHVQDPGWVLDVGCGTGRLLVRLGSAYRQARLMGVDPSAMMIKKGVAARGQQRARFTAASAERLPFADAAFDLVVATMSVSHWGDAAAGLAEISRVMAPDATLVAADVFRARPSRWPTVRPRRREPDPSLRLLSLVTASGLRTKRADPIRSVALIADAVLVTARKQH
jgi:SAM-dependent methyltransferase